MNKVSFFIHSKHSVGGVTTWSHQALDFLSNDFKPNIVSVYSRENGDTKNKHFFKRKLKTVNTDLKPVILDKAITSVIQSDSFSSKGRHEMDNLSIPTIPTIPSKPTRPTKPTLPTKKTPPTRPTAPTKPTIPTKPTKGCFLLESIDVSAKSILLNTKIFIPNYIEYGYKLAVLSRTLDLPTRCIGICHTDDSHYYTLLTKYEPIIHKFIAVSNRCAHTLKTFLPPERYKDIECIPYGVNVPDQPIASYNGQVIKLLYSGRFDNDQKRIFDLIKVIKRLQENNINYSFDFIGEGPNKEELLQIIKNNFAENVRILDPLSYQEMQKEYSKYHVLLMCSKSEGTSISMLEAMSNGVVPIVTRVSGAEDLIVNGQNGFICDVGDVDRMADAVIFLYNNPEKWAQISLNSHFCVKSGYNINNQFAKFSFLLNQVKAEPMVAKETASVLKDKYLIKA